jgi:hypothetical protein
MSITALLTAVFLTTTLLDLWNYFRLKEKTIAKIEKWKVVEKGSKFAIQAYYSFETQGHTYPRTYPRAYQGKTTFSKPYHLNRQSAEKQIKIYTMKQWPVWYQESHPEHSSIDRIFPMKKCLYSLIVLAVFLYFVYLVKKSSTSKIFPH